MKTPMQELIELITLKENKEDGRVFLMPYITIAKLEAMLEKEKDAMCEFQELSQRTDYWVHYDGREDCFEKTFNTKEK